jgi:hypothetical protein
MKQLVSVTIFLISILGFSICSNDDVDSFRAFQSKNSGYCNSTTPVYCHIQYFLQYILLGKPNLNQTNIFDLVDKIPDDIDLFSIIALLSQNFNQFWTENYYDEDTFDGYKNISK